MMSVTSDWLHDLQTTLGTVEGLAISIPEGYESTLWELDEAQRHLESAWKEARARYLDETQ
uniref:Uncharacterized protein n=1 Tax=viral metagenome TaxID=1070528 RepID=A0A6M3LLW6_9ZZZZ